MAKPVHVAHVCRVGPSQRLADALGNALLVDAVGAGDQQQIGLARPTPAEHQRLHDLRHRAAAGRCRLLGGARGLASCAGPRCRGPGRRNASCTRRAAGFELAHAVSSWRGSRGTARRAIAPGNRRRYECSATVRNASGHGRAMQVDEATVRRIARLARDQGHRRGGQGAGEASSPASSTGSSSSTRSTPRATSSR